jgi:hypothetical protein
MMEEIAGLEHGIPRTATAPAVVHSDSSLALVDAATAFTLSRR